MLFLSLVLAAVVLLVEAAQEPYHIDELRQVRSYGRDLLEVGRRSLQQTQPPLDAWLNALTQRIIGVGDIRQRLLSIVWAIGSLVFLGGLLRRRLCPIAASVGVLGLALAPLFVNIASYARPYALPLFLMLGHLWGADRWIHGRARGGLVVATVFVVLLPLSRATEPLLFLVALVAVGTYLVRSKRKRGWNRQSTMPVLVPAGLSFLVVGVPSFLLVRANGMTQFTSDGLLPNLAQMSRVLTELPSVIAHVTPVWPAALLVIVLTVIDSEARERLRSMWWFWVLLLVPVGFALSFFAGTEVTQPYFDRYAFTWFPPFAVVLAVTAERSLDRIQVPRDAPWSAIRSIVGMGLVLVLLLGSSYATVRELVTTKNADWQEISRLVASTVPQDGTTLFDHPRSPGMYRTRFAGKPRYLDHEIMVPTVEAVLREPESLKHGSPVSVVLLGARPEVPGWVSIPAGRGFTLYVRPEPYVGPLGAAQACEDFAAALGDSRGAMMLLAASQLYEQHGLAERGKRILTSLLQRVEGELAERIRQQARRFDVELPQDGS